MIKGAVRYSMNNKGTEKSRRSGGENTQKAVPASEKKLRRMQGRQKKMRSASVKALLIAVVLLTVSILGSRVTSDNEQAIRLALGQKNYTEEGEQGPVYFDTDYSDPEELTQDSTELGLRIQREGIVLLRNENGALPIGKGASVSVFGENAVDPVYSRSDAAAGSVSLKEALEEQKIRVNDKLWDFIDRGGRNNFSARVEKSIEEYAEAAIVVIGRSSGGQDLYKPAYSEAEEGEEAVVTGARHRRRGAAAHSGRGGTSGLRQGALRQGHCGIEHRESDGNGIFGGVWNRRMPVDRRAGTRRYESCRPGAERSSESLRQAAGHLGL